MKWIIGLILFLVVILTILDNYLDEPPSTRRGNHIEGIVQWHSD